MPRFQRIKVSLMAAPAAIADVTYRDTSRGRRRVRAGGRRAVRADVHDRVLARDRGVGDAEPALRHAGGVRARGGRRAPHGVPRHRRPGPAAADRRARPRPRAPHAVRGPPAVGVPRRGSSWWSTPSTARSRASTRRTSGCTSAGATTRGRTPTTCRSRRSSRSSTRRNVGALVVSMANARHAHEVRCFERRPLPDGMALVAGVIDTTSNYVEHPEVVADRIERAARGGRRSPPHHRRHRLRLRHDRRHRRRGPQPRVGEAAAPCAPAPTWRRSACSERIEPSARCGRRGCSSARRARRRRGRCRR